MKQSKSSILKKSMMIAALFVVTNIFADSPLYTAARNGNVAKAKQLLSNGANVNVRTSSARFTPLHIACCKGRLEIVKLLLKNGANVAARAAGGSTSLHFACSKGSLEIAKLLLEKGANIEAKDDMKQTPLICGASHVKIVKLLLEKGADIETRDDIEYTPLHCGIYNVEVVKLLLEKGANIDAQGFNKLTPLMLVVKDDKNINVVKLLLEKGANINARNKFGQTPLSLATRQIKVIILNYEKNKSKRAREIVETEKRFKKRALEYEKNRPVRAKAAKVKFAKMSICDLLQAHPLKDDVTILALSDALLDSEENKLPRYLLQPNANPAKLRTAVKKRMRDAKMEITKCKDKAQDLKEEGKNAEAKKYRTLSIAISGYQDSLISIMNELNKD